MSYYNVTGEPITQDEWVRTLEAFDARRVAADGVGRAWVSTVHLGLDHRHGDGPPLIFETMIFGGEHDQEEWRYTTLAEAKAGHARAVALVKGEA